MRTSARVLIGALALASAGLACADGLQWVARDAGATLVPGGLGTGTATAFNVCRAAVGSMVVIGKVAPERPGECRIAVAGSEQVAADFEVLATASKADVSFTWVPGHATGYPMNAVIGGRAASGDRMLVCAAINRGDNSVHPGYIADENCVYAFNGNVAVADNYLVLVTDDPDMSATEEAQPALEGYDPSAILAIRAVTDLCALSEGLCVPPARH